MKLFMFLSALIISTAVLGACNTTVRDHDTSVTIQNNEDGYKCPPGHHMKGWC